MKRSIKLYIKDIVEYMERAEEHVKGLNHNQFLKDRKTGDAVIRCIEVIGEATKNIPDSIRNKYPSIPWRDMAGMRDKIIHGYFIVDFENVWLVVKEEIPKLKPLIKKILEDLEKLE
ncbi:DUF86 domain-containing protein [Peptococcaceae bacterium]|jgi:uncharacterized protein with HEPN domain|nr:DUF86 domain-containing protein [Peptococcaceae bacterium]